MERGSFKILFYINRAKILKNGEASIIMRITSNGQRVSLLVKRSIDPKLWDNTLSCVKGNSRAAKELNYFLETEKLRAHQIHSNMLLSGEYINVETLKDMLLGKNICHKTLVQILDEHNDKCKLLEGKDYTLSTIGRYLTSTKYIVEFLKKKYNKKDIYLTELNNEFISDFDLFLKTVKNCQQNSAIKHLKLLKKVTKLAVTNDWIKKDPFISYKFKLETIDKEFLTDEELNAIITKKFTIKRIEMVRDVFIFCCMTGLAFIDVKQLSKEHIVLGKNGEMWIRKPRQKSKQMCNIPLLEIPIQMIKKYEDDESCIKNNVLLPVMSNQKMNAYLKEVADLCGITKNLTTHVARHSFATSVALANGVSIESVAKMLGHSNTKTTHHYARILDKTISNEMKGLSSKFANITT